MLVARSRGLRLRERRGLRERCDALADRAQRVENQLGAGCRARRQLTGGRASGADHGAGRRPRAAFRRLLQRRRRSRRGRRQWDGRRLCATSESDLSRPLAGGGCGPRRSAVGGMRRLPGSGAALSAGGPAAPGAAGAGMAPTRKTHLILSLAQRKHLAVELKGPFCLTAAWHATLRSRHASHADAMTAPATQMGPDDSESTSSRATGGAAFPGGPGCRASPTRSPACGIGGLRRGTRRAGGGAMPAAAACRARVPRRGVAGGSNDGTNRTSVKVSIGAASG
jgi:hypothetical protein